MLTRSIRLAVVLAIVAIVDAGFARAECEPRALGAEPLPGVRGRVSLLHSWDPDGTGPEPAQLMVQGSSISGAGNVPADRAVIWNGLAWTAAAPLNIEALWPRSVNFEDSVIVAGDVQVARFTGVNWEYLPGIVHPSDVAVFRGTLYAAGSERVDATTLTTGVFRWSEGGWERVGTFDSMEGGLSINRLAVFNDELIAAGVFAGPSGIDAPGIAAWNGRVAHLGQWSPGRGPPRRKGPGGHGGSSCGAGECAGIRRLDRRVRRAHVANARGQRLSGQRDYR